MLPLACLGLVLGGVALLSLLVPALGAQEAAPGAAAGGAGAVSYEKSIRPLLKEYCHTCHSKEKHKGDLDLEQFVSIKDVKKHPKILQGLIEQIHSGEMPPKEKPQPSAAEREKLLAWAGGVLDEIALSRAGDPGPVVLRRLSNAEYTYTIRDLTGVDSLDPAREFPVDSGAGEGFTNVGNALVMSPSMVTKYLDAGKAIAEHAVLLPDGIRFSAKTTRRDRTEELLGEIRAFYRKYTDSGGGMAVNLQGIKFDTNSGGRLPLEKYLLFLLNERAAVAQPAADQSGLSTKYLNTLRQALDGKTPSILLDPLRARWKVAKPADAQTLATQIGQWQGTLWKFNTVGHIGKVGGPKGWMEPVSSLTTKHQVKMKLPASTDGKPVTIYLVASDGGDGSEHDDVVWERPRLVAPGRPDLLLRDVRQVGGEWFARRHRIFTGAQACLNAAAEAAVSTNKLDVEALAQKHGADAQALAAWLGYLGIGDGGPVAITGHFTEKLNSGGQYDFIKGWGTGQTPNLMANSSDKHVRVPGNMKPHGVAMHPSPKLAVAVGWRSPVGGNVGVKAVIQHAHPECGNGVTWSLELRRGATRQRLASGVSAGGTPVKPAPIESLAVRPGDLISLLVGPRDGNHSCDLTAVDLTITSAGQGGREWDLAKDVSPDVLAGNPHADRFGNDGVWHFYTEPEKGGPAGPVIPAGSLLAQWQAASGDQKKRLAGEVQALLIGGPPAKMDGPDAALYRQLSSFSSPIFAGQGGGAGKPAKGDGKSPSLPANPFQTAGLDAGRFGKHPDGSAIDPASLCVRAPSVIEIQLPAEFAEGSEFITTGSLHSKTGAEGSVQLLVTTTRPEGPTGLVAGGVKETNLNGTWTANNRLVTAAAPIVVNEGSAARRRIEASLDEFRALFPIALCYTKIVPVDEVVTLTLFYREDEPLRRLILNEAQTAQIDRLWDEMHYVSHDALTLVDAFDQLWQYATQDSDPSALEPLREPIKQRAAAFRKRLIDTQPEHVKAVIEFAGRATRRPLTEARIRELQAFYQKLRSQELPHEEAIQLMLARTLISPAFLYRSENASPGLAQTPVDDYELATRLSYFLWSSTPDARLLSLAAQGKLRDPDVLAAEAKRMIQDPRIRRLATEFGCQWLHVRDLDTLDEKSERHFPTFAGLRGAMLEESILFFADFFQKDGTIQSLLDADHTFVNGPLAEHYGIKGVKGTEWRRVDGMRALGRGGILGLASTLTRQSGASRTSPILRGNWVYEVVLGERLPRPPKDVPVLPNEPPQGLTERQLIEKHSSDPKCAGCHQKIDPMGFSLERFDAIGRYRTKDAAGLPIDSRAKLADGTPMDGLDGLRDYLLKSRREAFERQFTRKLLGYSLGRAVLISDRPLMNEMSAALKGGGDRVGVVIDKIVRSRQFREIRGRDFIDEE